MYDHLTEEERAMDARKLRQLLEEARVEVERLEGEYARYRHYVEHMGCQLAVLLDAARQGLPPEKEVKGCDWLEASWVELMVTEPLCFFEMHRGTREHGDLETGVKTLQEMQQRHEWSYSQDLREREERIKCKGKSN